MTDPLHSVETAVGVNPVARLLTNQLMGVDINLFTSTSFLADPLVQGISCLSGRPKFQF